MWGVEHSHKDICTILMQITLCSWTTFMLKCNYYSMRGTIFFRKSIYLFKNYLLHYVFYWVRVTISLPLFLLMILLLLFTLQISATMYMHIREERGRSEVYEKSLQSCCLWELKTTTLTWSCSPGFTSFHRVSFSNSKVVLSLILSRNRRCFSPLQASLHDCQQNLKYSWLNHL